MATKIRMSGLDYSREGTSLGVWMADLSAANFTAQTTAFEAIKTAIRNVSLIAFDGAEYPANQTDRENTPPADPFAQRESKWLVTMVDASTNEINQFEIGGADLSLLVAGTDLLDLTAGAGLALVTALEANAKSRIGNAVTVQQVRFVGRGT